MATTTFSRLTVLSALLAGVFPAGAAFATPAVLEPISFVNVQGFLSNDVDTIPVVEQAPGSLQTPLSGVLEVDLSGGNITFFGGSLILLANQGGSFLPSGTDANLAGEVPDILPGITAVGAFRNFTIDVIGGPIPLNPDGTFDASGLFFEALSGTFDYEVPGFLGPFSDTLFGEFSTGSLTGSVTPLGGNKHRVIVPFSLSFLTTVEGLTLDLTVAGRISAITPEPSSYALAATALVALAGIVWRRRVTARPRCDVSGQT